VAYCFGFAQTLKIHWRPEGCITVTDGSEIENFPLASSESPEKTCWKMALPPKVACCPVVFDSVTV